MLKWFMKIHHSYNYIFAPKLFFVKITRRYYIIMVYDHDVRQILKNKALSMSVDVVIIFCIS